MNQVKLKKQKNQVKWEPCFKIPVWRLEKQIIGTHFNYTPPRSKLEH